MVEKMFQAVYDGISDFIPQDWIRLVFFAGYTEGSYSMKFYFKNSSDEYVDCFSIPGVSRISLIKLFADLDKILSEQRKSGNEEKAWTIFTMTVDDDGTFKADFEFDDHTKDLISYEKVWAERYLK